MNYRCIVQYDGTRYEGWQKQKRTEETIQGKLEKTLRKITGEEVQVIGAGRRGSFTGTGSEFPSEREMESGRIGNGFEWVFA